MRFTAKLSSCLICNGPISPFMEKAGFGYSRCIACDFIFVNPRPEARELATWYMNNSSPRGYASSEALTEWERSRSHWHEHLLFSKLAVKGKALDIGCGYGQNIELFLSYGARFQCYGIEPDRTVAQSCERRTGIRPFVGTFEEFSLSEKFDLIFLNQVIEHVIDPAQWIQKIRLMLASDGVVVFGTPNASGFYRRFLGARRDPFFHAPLHLNHFTVENLTLLLRNSQMTTVLSHRFSDLQPVSFRRTSRQPRWVTSGLWQAHRPIAASLDALGFGLLMYVAAKHC
jgi:SAM-dependent methyltransferase